MADHSHDPAPVAEPAISDLDLREQIEEALWSVDSIRVSKPVLEVKAEGGHATVSGIVGSPMMREQIEEVLSGLPVTISLADDAGIQYAAAYALAMDPRTSAIPPGYRLSSYNGHVYVTGKFTSEQVEAIKAVVGGVKAARAVSID